MRSPLDALTLIWVGLAQELRKELEKERDEHAAAAARGDVLQQQAEQLSQENRGLEQVRDKLSSENEQLRQRAEALADSAEALLAEKYATQKKVHTFSILDVHSAINPDIACCHRALKLSPNSQGALRKHACYSECLMLPVQRCVAWLAQKVVLAIGTNCAVHIQLETLQAESEAEAAKCAEQDEELRRCGLFPSCHSPLLFLNSAAQGLEGMPGSPAP